MQSDHRAPKNPSVRTLLALAAVVSLGCVLRVGVATFGTGAIDTEGAEYARIAENLLAGQGYRGIVTPGVELMFPPFYPFMIAGVSYLVPDFEIAARVVCLIFGALLPLGMFAVAARIYDRTTALWAAAAGALHPLLISMSAWTYSEVPYITLVTTGLYLLMRCMSGDGIAYFAGAGAVFGCAYLTRPEALALPFIGAAFVAGVRVRGIRQAARGIAVMVGTFAVIATPYVAFVSYHSGSLRFEGKTAINFEMARRVLAGEEYLEAIYGLGQTLEGRGVFLRPNSEVIRNAELSLVDLRRIVARASQNLKLLVETLGRAPFGSPLLPALAILGLFARPWAAGTRGPQLLLIAVVGVSAASLLTNIFAENSRYCWGYVPILLIWAVRGAHSLGDWTEQTINADHPGVPLSRRSRGAIALLLLGVMFAISAATVEDRVGGRRSRPTKAAGLWLRGQRGERVTVMDSQTNLAFHAGAEFVFIPNTSAERILAYADAKKVDFIVVRPRHPWVVGRKVVEDWGTQGIQHPRAELVYAADGSPGEELFIYRWSRRSLEGGGRDGGW
jgi:Dolichyl-phosphate-mannose-protein mannosyltransferase